MVSSSCHQTGLVVCVIHFARFARFAHFARFARFADAVRFASVSKLTDIITLSLFVIIEPGFLASLTGRHYFAQFARSLISAVTCIVAIIVLVAGVAFVTIDVFVIVAIIAWGDKGSARGIGGLRVTCAGPCDDAVAAAVDDDHCVGYPPHKRCATPRPPCPCQAGRLRPALPRDQRLTQDAA